MRTARRPRGARSPAAHRAPRTLSADATIRNERSGRRRASSTRSAKSRRGSAPTETTSSSDCTDGSGRKCSMSTPNATNSTRGPSAPSHARSSSTSPQPYATIVCSRRNASAKTRGAAGPRSCSRRSGKADRRVHDRRLHASEASEQRERDPDRVDGREDDVRAVQLAERREHPREVARVATAEPHARSSTRAAARVRAPGSNARLEVVPELEARAPELVEPVQAVARRVSRGGAQRLASQR